MHTILCTILGAGLFFSPLHHMRANGITNAQEVLVFQFIPALEKYQKSMSALLAVKETEYGQVAGRLQSVLTSAKEQLADIKNNFLTLKTHLNEQGGVYKLRLRQIQNFLKIVGKNGALEVEELDAWFVEQEGKLKMIEQRIAAVSGGSQALAQVQKGKKEQLPLPITTTSTPEQKPMQLQETQRSAKEFALLAKQEEMQKICYAYDVGVMQYAFAQYKKAAENIMNANAKDFSRQIQAETAYLAQISETIEAQEQINKKLKTVIAEVKQQQEQLNMLGEANKPTTDAELIKARKKIYLNLPLCELHVEESDVLLNAIAEYRKVFYMFLSKKNGDSQDLFKFKRDQEQNMINIDKSVNLQLNAISKKRVELQKIKSRV